MSKPFVSPTFRPTSSSSKPGIRRSSPMISGIRSLEPPPKGDAVAGAFVLDDGVIALLGAAILDGTERGVLVAELLDDLLDLGLVGGLDVRAEGEVAGVTELELGSDRDRGLEDQRLAFLGLDDLDVGVGEGQDRLLD